MIRRSQGNHHLRDVACAPNVMTTRVIHDADGLYRQEMKVLLCRLHLSDDCRVYTYSLTK